MNIINTRHSKLNIINTKHSKLNRPASRYPSVVLITVMSCSTAGCTVHEEVTILTSVAEPLIKDVRKQRGVTAAPDRTELSTYTVTYNSLD